MGRIQTPWKDADMLQHLTKRHRLCIDFETVTEMCRFVDDLKAGGVFPKNWDIETMMRNLEIDCGVYRVKPEANINIPLREKAKETKQ